MFECKSISLLRTRAKEEDYTDPLDRIVTSSSKCLRVCGFQLGRLAADKFVKSYRGFEL